MLPRGKVRRVFAFVVDDLWMKFEYIHYTRMALQKFVESQMQPGDLVAIMQTKGWNAGLHTFSSDKRQLLARISNLRWSTLRGPNLQPIGLPQISAIVYSIKALQDMPGRKFLLLVSTLFRQGQAKFIGVLGLALHILEITVCLPLLRIK